MRTTEARPGEATRDEVEHCQGVVGLDADATDHSRYLRDLLTHGVQGLLHQAARWHLQACGRAERRGRLDLAKHHLGRAWALIDEARRGLPPESPGRRVWRAALESAEGRP